jgi:Tol biopolymer transport system component
MIYSNGEAYRLLVYDREQNRYLYYCPLTTFDELSQPEPVWSPDGLYVILSSSFSDVLMQLFDIQTGNIYKLPEKGKASGWSDKFPTLWP